MPSWLLVVTQSQPSGPTATVRRRPYVPWSSATGVPAPPGAGTAHSRVPRSAAVKSVPLAYARPLGDASAGRQLTSGSRKPALPHAPWQAGQP
ncbi:hypothetical protein GCM10023074_58940 [Microbispora amethystogenes]|uniref:Uncharacterized protein n=1 Tax=Microbispora amethystogenes TaxID=1427754 RepID=A0ABQ4FIM6_9ACTN|nr:hypothetical protein Mam01_48310 [Microbispora amethystogenes]